MYSTSLQNTVMFYLLTYLLTLFRVKKSWNWLRCVDVVRPKEEKVVPFCAS